MPALAQPVVSTGPVSSSTQSCGKEIEITTSQSSVSESIVVTRSGNAVKISGGSHHGEARIVAEKLHGPGTDMALIGSGHLMFPAGRIELRLESFSLDTPFEALKVGLEKAFPGRKVSIVSG